MYVLFHDQGQRKYSQPLHIRSRVRETITCSRRPEIHSDQLRSSVSHLANLRVAHGECGDLRGDTLVAAQGWPKSTRRLQGGRQHQAYWKVSSAVDESRAQAHGCRQHLRLWLRCPAASAVHSDSKSRTPCHCRCRRRSAALISVVLCVSRFPTGTQRRAPVVRTSSCCRACVV